MQWDYSRRVDELKARLSALLDTWYFMKEYAEPELWHRYETVFGDLEDRLAEKELQLHKIEMLIESRNEGLLQSFDLRTSKKGAYRLSSCFIEEEAEHGNVQLIDRIYGKLIKLLHPDLCKSKALSASYWHLVKDAKEKNDVERLSTYWEILSLDQDAKKNEDIHNSIQKLEKKIADYESKINRLKMMEPFVYQSKLGNGQWVESKRDTLLKQILLTDIRLTQKQRLLECYSSGNIC